MNYIAKKKILIISNMLYFEEGKGYVGHSKDVIYSFNKGSFVKNSIEKNFPEIKNIFIIGDHLNDNDSIKDLNMTQDNIIDLCFINIKPGLIGDETKKENLSSNNDQTFDDIRDSKFLKNAIKFIISDLPDP